jgi:uncharacterized protein (TIGR00369 family)
MEKDALMDDIRRLVERVTSAPGYTSSVGTKVLHAERGKVHLQVDRRLDLLQFSGFFHGGVIAGLADHAAGGAATAAMPPGKIAITVEFKINFLNPADGEAIIARAEATQSGGTIAVVKLRRRKREGRRGNAVRALYCDHACGGRAG